MSSLPYRDFYFPLNVFMHILGAEEGGARDLHYGLFTHPDESISEAQERSTELLLARLPPPPAKLLDAGVGLGTTLARLVELGYDATGITPDEKQIEMIVERRPLRPPDETAPPSTSLRASSAGAAPLRVQCIRFEDYPAESFDAILFQESAQYIDSNALFARARELAPRVIVVDEFSLRPVDFPGALHSFEGFLDAASRHGFRVIEEVDLSAQAAPTIDYFNARLARFREPLIRDLGITNEQVDHLIENGVRYREFYRDGTYGYRLLVFSL